MSRKPLWRPSSHSTQCIRARPHPTARRGLPAAWAHPQLGGIPRRLETSPEMAGIDKCSIKSPGTHAGSQRTSNTVLQKMPKLLEHELCVVSIFSDSSWFYDALTAPCLAREGNGSYDPRAPWKGERKGRKSHHCPQHCRAEGRGNRAARCQLSPPNSDTRGCCDRHRFGKEEKRENNLGGSNRCNVGWCSVTLCGSKDAVNMEELRGREWDLGWRRCGIPLSQKGQNSCKNCKFNKGQRSLWRMAAGEHLTWSSGEMTERSTICEARK